MKPNGGHRSIYVSLRIPINLCSFCPFGHLSILNYKRRRIEQLHMETKPRNARKYIKLSCIMNIGGKQRQTTPKNLPSMQRTRAILGFVSCPNWSKGCILIIIMNVIYVLHVSPTLVAIPREMH